VTGVQTCALPICEINRCFKDILGLNGIDHFSLDLVNPAGEMTFFSSTPAHAYEICHRGLAPYDGIISPQHYENNEFYWWESAHHKAFSKKIQDIRQNVLKLKNGFMLVRQWDNYYIIYSFATKAKTTKVELNSFIVNNLNKYLEMGDYAFNNLRHLYAEYLDKETPKINQFFGFKGGKPVPRYTHHHNEQTNSLHNNVIHLNNLPQK